MTRSRYASISRPIRAVSRSFIGFKWDEHGDRLAPVGDDDPLPLGHPLEEMGEVGGAWGQTEFQVNLKLGLTPRRSGLTPRSRVLPKSRGQQFRVRDDVRAGLTRGLEAPMIIGLLPDTRLQP